MGFGQRKRAGPFGQALRPRLENDRVLDDCRDDLRMMRAFAPRFPASHGQDGGLVVADFASGNTQPIAGVFIRKADRADQCEAGCQQADRYR